MAGHHESCRRQRANLDSAPTKFLGAAADASPVDPRCFGLVKAAYGVGETLELLSIGRTSLYAAVKRGELTPVKFGKKTLFCASDLATFLMRLKEVSLKPKDASLRRRSG